MCNILYLKSGQMPDRREFKNMCHNNWHSYGLVTKIDGKLSIIKKVPEGGEIDDQEIWDLLVRDKDYERFLHVRHNTAGLTNLENAHPIPIYFEPSTGKHVEFMHNGTMYQYKSKKLSPTGTSIDDDDGPSDTKNYADQVLTPTIAGCNFGTGKADLWHPMIRKILNQFWPTSNRGVLISGDQAPLLFGDWKEYKVKDSFGKEDIILSANIDYFPSVTRGPEFDRRKEEEQKILAAAKGTKKEVGGEQKYAVVTPLSKFQFGLKHGFFSLKDSLVNVLSDWNVYDRSGATRLGFATKPELEELYQSKSDCITVMDWVFTDYAKLYEEMMELEEDKDICTKMIATMKGELTDLRNLVHGNKEQASA